MTKDIITAQEIITIREQGRVVWVEPRNLVVRVDGFKRYRITKASIDTLRHWNNGKVN